jgi:hypothetical protein
MDLGISLINITEISRSLADPEGALAFNILNLGSY